MEEVEEINEVDEEEKAEKEEVVNRIIECLKQIGIRIGRNDELQEKVELIKKVMSSGDCVERRKKIETDSETEKYFKQNDTPGISYLGAALRQY